MDKYIYRGKLERVVDGDTIDALIDVGFDIWIKKESDTVELTLGNQEPEI